jgi:hypothetical protein
MLALLAQNGSAPTPASPAPPAATTLSDPCGGPQELLKKYLAASPCVFVRGQADVQATYASTNTPVVITHTVGSRTTTTMQSSHSFGYPGVLVDVGVTPSSQISVVPPSFSQTASSESGITAGATDMEFRYKQLLYSDRQRGILGGVLLIYQAPTGSPGLSEVSPSYEINPLLNLALNKARSIAESLAFPVSNVPTQSSVGGASTRAWVFSPQAVTLWRSPGSTLVALILQHNFATGTTYLTLNSAQLLARHFQLQATYGGNSANINYTNPAEDLGQTTGTSYRRTLTFGFSYLIGRSDLSPP